MIEQEKHGTCGSIKEEYGMSPPRLSPDEILALQEGEEVIVTWHGGNGPHLYSIYHDPHDLSRWDEPLGVSREELITSARYVSRPSPTHKKKKTLPELIDSITDPATALAALEAWRAYSLDERDDFGFMVTSPKGYDEPRRWRVELFQWPRHYELEGWSWLGEGNTLAEATREALRKAEGRR